MKKYLLLILLFSFGIIIGQEDTITSEEIEVTNLIEGTLLLPDTDKPPLVIIIAGSGPTDRDGNQAMQKNNSLRFLAEGLYSDNVASFRYDKRLLKIMKMGRIDESKIDFNHFIEDAVATLNYFRNDERFGKIYLLGHSQGSLVGMIAAQQGADGFISIGGCGPTHR